MPRVPERIPFHAELPAAARPATEIVGVLAAAGHQAVLAGGCVRDLLLGQSPSDYDVATDAPPERVSSLFRTTRHVGAQFGVVLVKRRGRWVEVATFRADGPYLDGRHPTVITLSDSEHDARRRDFTVNGMFLDPLRREIVDYVDGRADLERRLIRAIGDPAARFSEDYLRLLRAVRFAARLGFALEAGTQAAIRAHAPRLVQVAPERVREELERMLAHPSRTRAWELLRDGGLLPYLWPGAAWDAAAADRTATLLGRLPARATFELALAVLLLDCTPDEVERIARDLTLSNEQRGAVAWLVARQADLDDPGRPTLAKLKRLMSGPDFTALRALARARHADFADAAARDAALEDRLARIAPESVQPPPLITGDDLIARGLTPGPLFRRLLDELYTRQLDETLHDHAAALAALDELLRTSSCDPANDRRGGRA